MIGITDSLTAKQHWFLSWILQKCTLNWLYTEILLALVSCCLQQPFHSHSVSFSPSQPLAMWVGGANGCWAARAGQSCILGGTFGRDFAKLLCQLGELFLEFDVGSLEHSGRMVSSWSLTDRMIHFSKISLSLRLFFPSATTILTQGSTEPSNGTWQVLKLNLWHTSVQYPWLQKRVKLYAQCYFTLWFLWALLFPASCSL